MTGQASLLREQWVTVDGVRLFSHVGGGPASVGAMPIVFVHGFGAAGTYLLPTAEQLASDYAVFIPDLPGWGLSDEPDHALDLRELADVLAEYIRVQGFERVVLLGNSFGCQVIVELAVRRPGMVHRAVLVGPTLDPETRSVARLAWRLARTTVQEHPLQLLIAGRDYVRFGVRNSIKTLQFMIDDPLIEKLTGLAVPVLLVRGEFDPIATPEWVKEMDRLIPESEIAVIPGAGHAPNFDEPDALAALVRRFPADQAGK